MERRVLLALGVGFLVIAVGVGAFWSNVRPGPPLALFVVWPPTFAAGFGLSRFLKAPLVRSLRGAVGIVGLWAVLWGLFISFPPPFFSREPQFWIDMLEGAGTNAIMMSGASLGQALWLRKPAAQQ